MRDSKSPAVFLDRDGVIIVDKNFQIDPNSIEFIPRALDGMRKLDGRYLIVIISNQSGVARGYFSSEDVETFNKVLNDKMIDNGIKVAGWYFCPHGPQDGCDCRKPNAGLILRATRDLPIYLQASWMVGDKPSDIEAGKAAGLRTILVGTGYGDSDNSGSQTKPDYYAKDLLQAMDIINRG